MATIDDSLQFVVLAPQGAELPRSSVGLQADRAQHERLFREMQRLRGRVALREEAITASSLDSSGGYPMEGDRNSWHLLRLRPDGKIAGCARILVHPRDVIFQRLRVATSSVARSATWAKQVRDAVESELRLARLRHLRTIEPGGWVIEENLRGTSEAVSIALSAFAWARILGDCVGFLTATVKHRSAAILRRLGACQLEVGGTTIPAYFDPAWGCDMELLRFDTDSLNHKYDNALGSSMRRLINAPVYSAEAPRRKSTHVWFTHSRISTRFGSWVEIPGRQEVGLLAQPAELSLHPASLSL